MALTQEGQDKLREKPQLEQKRQWAHGDDFRRCTCERCGFVDSLMDHPQGDRLLVAWWRMRRMEPAFAEYLGEGTLAAITQQVIESAITRNKGNITHAATELGVSRWTIYRAVKKPVTGH